jgi:hypothetical protein
MNTRKRMPPSKGSIVDRRPPTAARRVAFAFLAVAVIVSITAVAGVAGADSGRKVEGDFTAAPPPPLECTSPIGICTRGTLTGGIEGTYDFRMLTIAPDPSNPADLLFTGESTITIENAPRGVLIGQDHGVIHPPQAVGEPSPFTTFIVIVDGTCAYEGASGEIRADGVLDAQGNTSGTYVGRIAMGPGGGRCE